MIKWLKIQNYAIIDHLEMQFPNGLTIITGETGAGKSILLGALGLLMGDRSDTKSLYDVTQKCIIEGLFEIKHYDLKDFCTENDIDYEEELVIRRELTPAGKSRAFVNDTPVNLKTLQDLSGYLLDVHQQFDTQDIHDMEFQIAMIDALAGNKGNLQTYQTQYKQYRKNKKRLEELVAQNQRAAQEMDFLNYQLEELSNAALIEDEQERLEVELERLTNAEDIKRTLGAAYQYLSDSEQSIIGQLQSLNISIASVQRYDSRIQKLYERFDGLIYELQDVANEFEQIGEATEFDQERIVEIQERVNLIYRLQKKHHLKSVSELIALQQQLQAQYHSFADLSTEITTLETTIQQQEQQLLELAKVLSEKRQAVAPQFAQQVEQMLHELAMEHAKIKIEFSQVTELLPSGSDNVSYLFAANKGSRLLPIKDVASGGEQSRLALVTKSLVASAIPLPTLVFDEIDTGISGYVAQKMGDILRNLSNGHQVVSITHSPQVASKADTHFYVYKRLKNDRTVTQIKELTLDERVHVIAVMLSSDPPSEFAIQNARELVRNA